MGLYENLAEEYFHELVLEKILVPAIFENIVKICADV